MAEAVAIRSSPRREAPSELRKKAEDITRNVYRSLGESGKTPGESLAEALAVFDISLSESKIMNQAQAEKLSKTLNAIRFEGVTPENREAINSAAGILNRYIEDLTNEMTGKLGKQINEVNRADRKLLSNQSRVVTTARYNVSRALSALARG